MLVNARGILNKAMVESYAVPQFNINNLEWTKYVLEECQEVQSPVILGVSEGAAKYMGGYRTVYNLVVGLIADLNISIPVVLHLDHGSTLENCKKAIDAGFTSVMIDASSYPLDENIALVKDVMAYAKPKNITVEAEVGHIGGTEDNTSAEVAYADLEDCVSLVNETDIDFLAPALGSVHGLYKGRARIDLDRMGKINKAINVPLVLHGGTGIDDDTISKAILCGVCKINVNTELQGSWATAVRKFLKDDDKVYDPRKIIGSGQEAIKKAVRGKIMLFKSNNRI